MPSPRVWMYNENSARHRGVWHVIEGGLNLVPVKEQVYEHSHQIYTFHDDKCEGWEVYEGNGLYSWKGCTCKLQSTEFAIPTGKFYTTRHITPGHTIIRSQPVLCHQTWLNGNPVIRSYSKWNEKYEADKVYETVDRIVPLFTYEGDMPPGPTCSRCIKKSEALDGSQ